MLSAIIIGTHMKLLDAWVVTLGVVYCPIPADVGRPTWVGILDFQWPYSFRILAHSLDLLRPAIIPATHVKLLHVWVMAPGCQLLADFGRFGFVVRDSAFQNFMAQVRSL